MPFLEQALILLGTTAIVVPLFLRFGLSTVLGYLFAGVAIGPAGLALFTDTETILHVAELGIVLLLFMHGLELEPARLWEMRRAFFGLGTAQVALTGGLIAATALALGLGWPAAIVIGIALSFSSTAFVLQLLNEKNELTTDYGRASIAVLLLQDAAVAPALAVLPLLSGQADTASGSLERKALLAVAVFVGLAVANRLVVRRLFRVVADTRSRELLTATALTVALGAAFAVGQVGLSMALGAFLGGVMLADSEYQHELQASIEPFKGLLLGLFFVGVGMSMNVGLLVSRPLVVLGLVLALMALKAAVLYGLGRWFLGSAERAVGMAAALLQGGEFAFVLLAQAAGYGIVSTHVRELLAVVVSLSMCATPVAFGVYLRLRPRLRVTAERPFDTTGFESTPVVIAGFGRVGQVVGRILQAKRIRFTALDVDPQHIDFLKRYQDKVFYGDASRLDLLRAARVGDARVFVLAIGDMEASLHSAALVRRHFPHVTILARARNREHAYRLLELGVDRFVRETFASSLELAADVLSELGLPYSESREAVESFREHDDHMLRNEAPAREDELRLEARAELESLFARDAARR